MTLNKTVHLLGMRKVDQVAATCDDLIRPDPTDGNDAILVAVDVIQRARQR